MMRRYWVNFHRGVLLIWIIVGQGPLLNTYIWRLFFLFIFIYFFLAILVVKANSAKI